jgi:hypothetical protein
MRWLSLIGLISIVALVLLINTPYPVARMVGLLLAKQDKPPAWVMLPPDAQVFASSNDPGPKPGNIIGRIDFLTQMDVPAVTAFYMHRLALDGFTARNEGIGKLTPRESEILGISGTIRAERPKDHVSMVIELAGTEGTLHKSLLVVVYWRNWIP